MKRIRYGVATSLDGFIAGPKGEADWIVMDPEIDFTAIFSEFDTILVGRRTFVGMGGTGKEPLFNMKTLVVSNTLKQADCPGVTIVSDRLEETVTELRNQPGKDIWLFGGGLLFRSLAERGLVDGVDVAVIPVLLGGGIPLFPPPAKPVKLKLVKHRLYAATGTMSLQYAVER